MIHSFKYTGTNDEGNDVYELCVQLSDDGCPDSQQHLVIRVIIWKDAPADVIMDVLSSNKTKKWQLIATETGDKEALARLLYPVARKVTKVEIEPTGA